MDLIVWMIVVFGIMEAAALQKIPSVKEYFPHVRDDLTKVTWAHAVNSIADFQKALEDKVMMLEADVVIGTVVNANSTKSNIPIMGHPPDYNSDLSLEDFVTRVISLNNRVDIKLDFKSTDALNQSLSLLRTYKNNITFPLWLNADILLGPVNSTGTVVDADIFLRTCSEMFPEATLSPGWKVRFGGDITNGSYLPEHISAMKDALVRNKVSQPVTFPVQVGLASMSLETLPEILEVSGVTDKTLTLWGTAADPVDIKGLKDLLKAVGKSNVYTDLPQSLLDQVNSSGRMYSAVSSTCLLLVSLVTAVVCLNVLA